MLKNREEAGAGAQLYLDTIGEKLKDLNEDIQNADKDVERDLNELVAEKLLGVNSPEVREKILNFKTANQPLLVELRRKSLRRAEQRLLLLRNNLLELLALFDKNT